LLAQSPQKSRFEIACNLVRDPEMLMIATGEVTYIDRVDFLYLYRDRFNLSNQQWSDVFRYLIKGLPAYIDGRYILHYLDRFHLHPRDYKDLKNLLLVEHPRKFRQEDMINCPSFYEGKDALIAHGSYEPYRCKFGRVFQEGGEWQFSH